MDSIDVKGVEHFVWDDEIRGFALRVLASGRKSYVVQYRAGRRSRRITLGSSNVIPCEQARNRAIAIVAAARNGEDPAIERDNGRRAISVRELSVRFDAEHITIKLKASTAKEYRRNLRRFIVPALGQLSVAEIGRPDIARFHHEFRHIPYQANRCLEVISKMFNLAELWGLRPDGTNPRRHIAKYPEEKRQRFLNAVELSHVGQVLKEMEIERIELPSAILAIRLLILTGCRLGEIMTLKWEFVDLQEGVLRLPDSKTGAKLVRLGQAVVQLLRLTPRVDGNPWVIVGTLPGCRLSDLQKFWRRVRSQAGLKEVRIHDLRHTFASTAVASGQGLPMIGKLLSHTQVQTTARYAHLVAEPVKLAADSVSSELWRSMGEGAA